MVCQDILDCRNLGVQGAIRAETEEDNANMGHSLPEYEFPKVAIIGDKHASFRMCQHQDDIIG